jgi:hypothetical protein
MVKTKASEVSSLSSKISTVVTEYFECDYELDCTPLYKAIENAIVQEDENYDHIAEFLETGKWPHDQAGSVVGPSAEIQAKTWVTRFNPTEKKKVEWSQLPLHLAIVGGAPSNIIGGLVKLYPQALRCTDDQQMLPLHLSLRHGADDEIVAYLLMQFPEAVNAKGKNGRTPVDCALRARDKLRGIILETFVEKTKSRLQTAFMKEKAKFSANLDDTTIKLDKVTIELGTKIEALKKLQTENSNLASEFEALTALKAKMEEELMSQIQDITKEKADQEATAKQKIEKLTSDKLTESIELQKKIDALVAEKAAAEEAVRKAKEEETSMRTELETVQKSVASTVTVDDWNTLKKEVDTLQAYRLTKTKSQAKDSIDLLKGEIEKTLEETKSEARELKTELKLLQKTVSKLEKTETKAKTSDDVAKLQSEVETLRAELRERNDASKMKVDLAVLKKVMEVEIKKPEGKSKEQLAAIASAVAKTSPHALETKTNAELAELKAELESLSLELKETELARKTAVDVQELERSIDIAIKDADVNTKGELESMKPAIENLRKYIATINSKDDLVGVAKDVETLKELLHKKQVTSKIQFEASNLKETVNVELEKSAGMAQEKELLKMKDTIASLASASLQSKDIEDLQKIRDELSSLKKQLKEVEEATRTQLELDSLKKTVNEELIRATEKTVKDLSEMKKAVDAVNLEQKESKNLKESLATEIKRASGQTEKDLLELKQKVESINITDLESKNKGEWESIRKDLENLKVDLKQKQQLKLDDTEKELLAVKEAIAQINAEQESKNNAKFEELRKEMNALRDDLTPAPQESKKKGLKKFFFMKFLRPLIKTNAESNEDRVVASPDPNSDVPTILPPSLTAMSEANQDKDAASSDDEAGMPPAVQKVQSMEKGLAIQQSDTKEMEVTLALHQVMSTVAAEEERQATINAAAVKALPSFSSKQSPKKMLPSAMRKVRSMDPRMKNVTIDPYEVVRSWSKTVVQSNGNVELEPVCEEDARSEVTTERT